MSATRNRIGRVSARTPNIEVTYDGACPVCRLCAHRFTPSDQAERISLIDARAAPDQVAALWTRGFDADDGIVVKAGETYLSGAEAARFLAGRHAQSGRLEKLVAWCFGSPVRAALAYPLLRACRGVLLFLLRRERIRFSG